ncbi:MAG: O-antigen ligase family protein [Terriglobales bacterium]
MLIYYFIVLLSAVPKHPWFGEQIGGVSMFKLLGAISVLYALLQLTKRRTVPPFITTWPGRLFLLLFLWALTSFVANSLGGTMGQSAMMIYTSFLSFFLVTVIVVDSQQRLRWAVLSLIGAIVWASAYTIREWQLGGFGAARPGWVAGDANFFTAGALMVMPTMYFLAQAGQAKWERRFCLAALGISLVAVVAAASRGGLLGLSVAYTYVFLRSKQKLKLGLLVIPVLVFLLVAPSSPIKRIVAPNYGDKVSADSRLTLWSAGWKMIKRNPILGVGLGNFKYESSKEVSGGKMAHNTYVEYAAELGVFGMMCFLGILISSWRILRRIEKRAAAIKDKFFVAVTTGFQAGILAFCVTVFFAPGEYEKPLWVVVFLTACLPSVFDAYCATLPAHKEEHQPEPEPAAANPWATAWTTTRAWSIR